MSADAGRAVFAGEDLSALRAGARDRFRAEHIGEIFQQFNQLPFASVSDNILLPLRFTPRRRQRAAADEAGALCAALGLPEGILGSTAGRLPVALFLGVERVRTGARSGLADTISGTGLILRAVGPGADAALLGVPYRQCHQPRGLGELARHRGAPRGGLDRADPAGDSHRRVRVMGTTQGFFEHCRNRGGRALEIAAGGGWAIFMTR